MVLYVYYWYSYWLNNLMNSDITLLLLIYYITLSVYNELLYMDYATALKKWWSEQLAYLKTSLEQAPPALHHAEASVEHFYRPA